jgi:hypothetical protein
MRIFCSYSSISSSNFSFQRVDTGAWNACEITISSVWILDAATPRSKRQQRVCMWFRGVTRREKSTPENSLTPTRVRVAPVHHRDHCTRGVCAVEFNIRALIYICAHGVLCKEKVRNSQQGAAIILNNLTLHWHYRGEFATLSARAFIETVPEGIVSVVFGAHMHAHTRHRSPCDLF